jgi:hypothetical protein
MRFSSLAFSTVASAHFLLNYPQPRGEFDEDNQVKFCDGYNSAAKNRSQFPLSDTGFFSIKSTHEKWTGMHV